MMYRFLLFLAFPFFLQAQQGSDALPKPSQKSQQIADKPIPIYFSDLPRLKKASGKQAVFSRITVSKADTSLFRLLFCDNLVICLQNKKQLNYDKATIDSSIFRLCQFLDFDFAYKTFNSEVFFDYNLFDSTSTFFKVVFNKGASFEANRFYNGSIFRHTQFRDKTVFDGSEFKDGAILEQNEFYEDVSFRRVDFSKGLGIYESVFHRPPDFSDIQLPSNLVFNDVTFEFNQLADQNAKIDFSSSRLDSLRAANKNPSQKCLFQARRTDYSRFILPYDRFFLVFYNGTTYEEKISAYEALIKSCRDAGLTESVKGWDIEYRELQNEHKFGKPGILINCFNEYWWNFGYEKWRILVFWLPFFFCCFLLYNYWRIKILWAKMYKDDELGIKFRKNEQPVTLNFRNWKQRFAFTFFFTAVIYFGFKLRHESVNYNYTRGLLYLYFMYAVGILHMAFSFSYILSAY